MFNNWSGRFKRLQVEIRRRWLSEESILSSFTARINPVTMLAVLFLIAAFGVFATRALVAHFDSIAHRMVPIDTVNGLPYAPPVDLVMTAGLPGFWDNNRLLAFARDPDPHDVPMVARIDKSDGCTAHIAKETLVVASDAEISGCALIGKIDDGHGPVAELPVRINVRAVAASAMGWGYGGDGALGDGTGYSTHIRPSPVQSGASSGVWTLLAAGLHHSCAIDTKGRPWCWGRGSEGQVGAGRSSLYGGPEREPVAVHLPSNIKLTTIAVGDFHSCGADRKGALWCWGDNGAGQLGRTHKATLRASTPIKIDLPKEAEPVVAVAAGALHSCALDAKGNIHCFGYGGQGELGSGRGGPKASSATAVTVQKPDSRIRFVQLAAGAYHNCALDAAHRLWCWGADRTGKLGAGKILSTVTVPHEVAQPQGVTGWSFVATGQDATCAIDSIGDVWCWGSGRGG
ncbi:MAG: hypothetical protein U9N14_07780, partial [Pseudomonadota bacterium]|nr:hypothetical protein [Pseudomonadota bacterium]